MDILDLFEMENLKMVRDNQELLNSRLAEREPLMITALWFMMKGFEFSTIGLLESLKEYQEIKEDSKGLLSNGLKISPRGCLPHSDNKALLLNMKKRNDELKKEYEQIRLDVETVCEKALIIAGLKEIV
ncbi:hypothetical protein IEO70_02235 [Bacillus sp. AGMB 02131]|uniref:Uncharacterized protein n=1 Tax=Peribacillus faecalis TaxID=2772559 RepID=A0A927CUA7_9BACI|nr:hypothetical protein [Peribacillus faecalis]MBD3107186.1 hypothetical protein [Peribacillus faecalis]